MHVLCFCTLSLYAMTGMYGYAKCHEFKQKVNQSIIITVYNDVIYSDVTEIINKFGVGRSFNTLERKE